MQSIVEEGEERKLLRVNKKERKPILHIDKTKK
jgi:hypothetical protein